MNDKGKLKDVLIENVTFEDQKTGIKMPSFVLKVWANLGKKELIKNVEGVANVYCNVSPTQYDVYIDHRYDIDFVSKEIEAVILCNEGE
jgi:hypothetical protein